MRLGARGQAPRRPADAGPAWTPLFNGEDLSGWKIVGKERWVVDGGTIYGQSVTPKGDGFLKTEKTYKDFYVFLRYKCETNTNSGLFYHSGIEEDISRIRFIQVEIDNSIGNHTGGLHGDRDGKASKGWIVWPAPENETVIRPFDWNEMLVMVEGQRIRTRVNGVQRIDFTYPQPNNTDGVIALQIHPGGHDRGPSRASRTGCRKHRVGSLVTRCDRDGPFSTTSGRVGHSRPWLRDVQLPAGPDAGNASLSR